jgi:hypothetical protein
MFGIRIRRTAKAAFFVIAARTAQMSGLVCYCTARFTCIGHDEPPLELAVFWVQSSPFRVELSQNRHIELISDVFHNL